MKKTIAWLLLVVMLLGTFAGCGNAEQTPTTAAENGAADAIAYLKAYYKDAGTETFADFDRLGIVRIAGVAYTVVWTADVAEDLIKVVVNEDGSVTIDVNESNETATPYNLTATVTDDAGNTASHSWNYILPVGLGNDYGAIVDMAYELENGQAFEFDSTLVGTVTAINTAWSDEYKNITVTIVIEGREDKPIMCYRLKGEGAQDLAAGDLITVTGKLKNYNGTIEFDSGCTLDKVEKGAGTLGDVPTDPLEIVDAAFALEVGASLPYTATLTGEVVSIDTPYSADYKNITVSIKVEGREDKPIMCYRMKGEGADQVMPGDTITVSGVIKNYNGTIEFDAGCSLVELIKGENSFVMPSTTAELLEMAYNLKVGEAIPVQVTLTGLIFAVDTPYSDRYGNISVWMVVDGMYDKPVLAFRMKGADVDKIWTNDTITVTGTLKNYNGTVEFDAGCKLDSWIDTGLNPSYPKTQKEIVDALYALRENETFHGIYSLTGRVVEADAYSSNYGNQTITIDVEGRKVDVYRMTTGGVEIAEGDHVTVRGNLEDYKGKKQMTSAYLTWYDETTLAEAMAECEALGDGGRLSYNEVTTGTIKITSPYSSKYNNISFELTDAYGTTVLCYRVKGYGMENWVDGDTVTVSGKLVNFKGTAQYDSSARVVCQRIIPETLESQIEAASFLSNGVYLHVPSTIIGKVSFIDSPYSAQYGNISFYVTNEEGIELYCYRVKGDGMDKLALGDTVKVEGYLTAYKGTAQFDSTATVTILEKGDGTYDDGKEDLEVASIADGTYVIVAGNQALTALAETYSYGYMDGTEVTYANGTVTGYTDANIFTVKNTANGFTITDCYGRLVYMSGSYNSFNVKTSASSGHEWIALKAGNGVYNIQNVAMAKTLAWDTNYSSFGAYPEVKSTHVAEVAIIAVTAAPDTGDGEPTEPSEPETEATEPETEATEPEKPTYNTFAEMVEAASKLANKQTLGVTTTQTGTIIDTPEFNDGYNNWNFTLDVDGVEIYCYALLKGEASVVKGGTVKVTGDLTAHYGKPQFSNKTVTEAIYTAPAGGETPDEPEQPDTPTGPEVATIENGTYLIMCGNKAMTTKAASYGFLPGTDITFTDGNPTGYTQESIFTITNVSGGFTITDTNGKVLAASGDDYDSFTIGATSGTTFVAYKTATDGVYNIVNIALNETICNDPSYGSFGTYATVGSRLADIYLIAVDATVPETPTTPEVATIANGTYLIMCGNKAMTTKDAGYGYLPGTDITFADGKATGYTQESIFTITNTTGGFTITDSNGKVLGASAEHKTFTIGATSGTTYVAYKTATEGVVTIVNVDLNKTVCNDPAYGSFGNYAEVGTFLSDLYLIAVDATVPTPPTGGEGEGGTEGQTKTVTVKFQDYASTNKWENQVRYYTVVLDENVTATAQGSQYTGRCMENNKWVMYQADSGTFTISAGGKTIKSVTIEYNYSNGGCPTYNGSNVSSGTSVSVNGTSATFGVASNTGKTNGQVKIKSITVLYVID